MRETRKHGAKRGRLRELRRRIVCLPLYAARVDGVHGATLKRQNRTLRKRGKGYSTRNFQEHTVELQKQTGGGTYIVKTTRNCALPLIMRA